jgi:DNA-binding Xre family transcriptional regulator
MAWEEYSPRAIRTMMLSRNLTSGDVARRSKGKVGRATVRELTVGRNPTAQTTTLEAVAWALSVAVGDLCGEEGS